MPHRTRWNQQHGGGLHANVSDDVVGEAARLRPAANADRLRRFIREHRLAIHPILEENFVEPLYAVYPRMAEMMLLDHIRGLLGLTPAFAKAHLWEALEADRTHWPADVLTWRATNPLNAVGRTAADYGLTVLGPLTWWADMGQRLQEIATAAPDAISDGDGENAEVVRETCACERACWNYVTNEGDMCDYCHPDLECYCEGSVDEEPEPCCVGGWETWYRLEAQRLQQCAECSE